MQRRTPRADVVRLGQVLAGVRYPAAKWQLIAHADNYGADSLTQADLWRLPVGVYRDLAAVCAALELPAPLAPARPPALVPYRTQPRLHAAAADSGGRPSPDPG